MQESRIRCIPRLGKESFHMDFGSADTVKGEVTAFGDGIDEIGIPIFRCPAGVRDLPESLVPIIVKIFGLGIRAPVGFQFLQRHVEYGHGGLLFSFSIMRRTNAPCQRFSPLCSLTTEGANGQTGRHDD
jgi:hypothetical protein